MIDMADSKLPQINEINLPAEEEKTVTISFMNAWREKSLFSWFCFGFARDLIDRIKGNNDKMTEGMIEDMKSTDDETETMVNFFFDNLKKREEAQKQLEKSTGEKQEYYYVLRNAVWDTFGKKVLLNAFMTFSSDMFSIAYTSYLLVLIRYIRDENATLGEGIVKLLIFSSMMTAMSLLKNH